MARTKTTGRLIDDDGTEYVVSPNGERSEVPHTERQQATGSPADDEAETERGEELQQATESPAASIHGDESSAPASHGKGKRIIPEQVLSEEEVTQSSGEEGQDQLDPEGDVRGSSDDSALSSSSRSHSWRRMLHLSRYSLFLPVHLEAFCKFYCISPEMGARTQRPNEHSSDPLDSRWAVSTSMFTYGGYLPATSFTNKVLTYLNKAPSQLGCKSWINLIAFQVRCAMAKIEPSLELLNRYYRVTHDGWVTSIAAKNGGQRVILNMPPKNDIHRSFGQWFTVANGFSQEVPKSWTSKAEGRYLRGLEKADGGDTNEFHHCNVKKCFQLILHPFTLEKAGLRPVPPPLPGRPPAKEVSWG